MWITQSCNSGFCSAGQFVALKRDKDTDNDNSPLHFCRYLGFRKFETPNLIQENSFHNITWTYFPTKNVLICSSRILCSNLPFSGLQIEKSLKAINLSMHFQGADSENGEFIMWTVLMHIHSRKRSVQKVKWM